MTFANMDSAPADGRVILVRFGLEGETPRYEEVRWDWLARTWVDPRDNNRRFPPDPTMQWTRIDDATP